MSLNIIEMYNLGAYYSYLYTRPPVIIYICVFCGDNLMEKKEKSTIGINNENKKQEKYHFKAEGNSILKTIASFSYLSDHATYEHTHSIKFRIKSRQAPKQVCIWQESYLACKLCILKSPRKLLIYPWRGLNRFFQKSC